MEVEVYKISCELILKKKILKIRESLQKPNTVKHNKTYHFENGEENYVKLSQMQLSPDKNLYILIYQEPKYLKNNIKKCINDLKKDLI